MKFQVQVRYKRRDVVAEANFDNEFKVYYRGKDIKNHISDEEVAHIMEQYERLNDNFWTTDIA